MNTLELKEPSQKPHKLNSYKLMKNGKQLLFGSGCKEHEDCFTCPFSDCIAQKIKS